MVRMQSNHWSALKTGTRLVDAPGRCERGVGGEGEHTGWVGRGVEGGRGTAAGGGGGNSLHSRDV